MFTHRSSRALLLAALGLGALTACDDAGTPKRAAPATESAVAARIAESPNLGAEIVHADIAAWDIAVGPDGASLPPGEGAAVDGEQLYLEQCSYCHGKEGEGNPADRLVGGVGTLTTDKPVRTVGSYWPYATTLFDYIRRSMPLNAPQSLSDDQVYALTAWILAKNGIIGADQKMSAQTVPQVKMPNREAFYQVYPEKDVK